MIIRDIHYHIDFSNNSLADSVKYFKENMRRQNVKQISVLAIPTLASHVCRVENLKTLTVKDMMKPDVFAFFGLWYKQERTAEDFLNQLNDALKQGFDGIKFLEPKPDIRKLIGYGIDDPVYDLLLNRAEELGLPVLMHVNDPEESWDIDKVDPWAYEHGRFYGLPGFCTKEELYAEIDKMLDKHPRLRLTLAHFYFLSADLDRAAAFLDTHPNVHFDLTPGKEMFRNFSVDPEKTRRFFTKYADRLMLGTDTNNGDLRFSYRDQILGLILHYLTDSEPFTLWNTEYRPIHLDSETVEKITYRNAPLWQGKVPKETNRDEIIKEIEKVGKEYDTFSDEDKAIYKEICNFYHV